MKKLKTCHTVALVVTIIIIIILAGISIAAISGENGIIKRAAQAKEDTDKSLWRETRAP